MIHEREIGILGKEREAISHPVIQLIKERLENDSKPGNRNDSARLVLAVEGGGMRSTVTGAMATTLDILGLQNVFDVAYGSSAGASNSGYFLAHQGVEAMHVYLDNINSRDFIDLLRPLKGKPIVDLTFGFNEVMGKRIPIDWKAIAESKVPLKILATDVEKGEIAVFDKFTSQQDLLDALHASARMPIVAGIKPFSYRGGLFWDASLLDAFGINTALNEGATHVLVLRSRPVGRQERKLSAFDRRIVAPYIRRFNPTLADLFMKRMDPQFNGTAKLKSSEQNPTSSPYLFSISPREGMPEVGRLETRRDHLIAGAKSGVEAVLSALEPEESMAERVRVAFKQYDQTVAKSTFTGRVASQ